VFAPDGKHLATADGQAHLWEAGTPEPVAAFEKLNWPAVTVAFSPDGKRLAAFGGTPGAWGVKVWDLSENKEVFAAPTEFCGAIAFLPGGKRLALASSKTGLSICDLESGKSEVSALGEFFTSAFTPDGTRLVFSRQRNEVVIWDVAAGKQIATFRHGLAPTFAFRPDGKVVACIVNVGVTLFDATTGQEVASYAGFGAEGRVVAYSPDGQWLAAAAHTGGGGGTPIKGVVKAWPTAARPAFLAVDHTDGSVNALAFSPDGRRLAAAHGGRDLVVRDGSDGRPLLRFKGHAETPRALAWSPDGKRLLSAAVDVPNLPGKPGELKLWDAETGKEVRALTGHTHSVGDVACSPKGDVFATAGATFPDGDRPGQGEVVLWSALTGVKIRSFWKGWGTEVLTFTPDAQALLTAGPITPKTAQLNSFRMTDFQQTGSGPNAPGYLRVVVSPGGESFALVFNTGMVQVCAFEKRQLLFAVNISGARVNDVAFSPDGKRLVVGLSDGTIRICETINGRTVLTLDSFPDAVARVAFSSDGKHIAGAATDPKGTLRLWTGGPRETP
jgi:WD40 repeat protein